MEETESFPRDWCPVSYYDVLGSLFSSLFDSIVRFSYWNFNEKPVYCKIWYINNTRSQNLLFVVLYLHFAHDFDSSSPSVVSLDLPPVNKVVKVETGVVLSCFGLSS
jgi:hypothetical protein